jgi:multidrug efflux pump subunit AcrA (membrane-fusion protein)
MKSYLIRYVLLGAFFALACEKDKQKQGANSMSQPPAPEVANGEMHRKNRSGKEGGGPGDRPKSIAVRVQNVESQNLPETVEVVGVFVGRKQADVYSRVPGKLSYIGPSEGRSVKEGEVLFRVDRSDPGESFLATPIASPITGWVGRWLVTSIGAQVTAQEAVVSVVDDEALKTSVMLPTGQWLKVSTTTPVRIRVDGEIRSARVIGIARAAEATASRGTVTVEISNSEHKWKAGMVALVAFDVDIKPRIVVPASALAITDQGPFVFVVQDGKASRVAVKFTVIDIDRVEILEGVATGAQLIIEGINQVSDGLAVKIVDDGIGAK